MYIHILYIISILFVSIFHYSVKDLISLLKVAADDWLKIKTEKELTVMIKHARNGRIPAMFGYIFLILGMILIVFLPYLGISQRYVTNMTSLNKNLPFQSYYLYDKDRSPYYEITFAAQGCVIFIFAACYMGVDTLLGLVVFHLCGQLENLTGKLNDMDKYNNFNDRLTFIVEDHTRLIKFCINFSHEIM